MKSPYASIFSLMLPFAGFLLLCSFCVRNASAQGIPDTVQAPLVILVRHADRAAAPADDPSLSPEGMERARALDLALSASGITSIITTEFKRARETAAPVAGRFGITPDVISVRGAASHVQDVVAAIRKQRGVVLVVGHSNTVPAIIAALGAEKMRDLCETDYDNLFVVVSVPSGVKLVKARYGAMDQSDLSQPSCTPQR